MVKFEEKKKNYKSKKKKIKILYIFFICGYDFMSTLLD